jgi:NADPH:quinone reductase
MKAAYYDSPGPPDVLRYGDLPTPEPKAGEARVRVTAAAVNPIDTYIRSGAVAMPRPKPAVPGADFAGLVDAIGSGVKRFRVGDRVWGSNQGLFDRQGTFAQFVCAGEDWLYPTPDGVSDEHAAAAALVGITAHLGLFRTAKLQAGEALFVNGGTGGVGMMVVQMAKVAGARVIATVGSPEKAELCRSLGADVALNYRDVDLAAELPKHSADTKGINVWFETQREHDFLRTVPLMAMRGRIVVMAGRQGQPVLPVGQFYTRDLSLLGLSMMNASAAEQRACAEDIGRWLAEQRLHVFIGREFPLSEAAVAHRLQEENTLHKAGTLTGKIIVRP